MESGGEEQMERRYRGGEIKEGNRKGKEDGRKTRRRTGSCSSLGSDDPSVSSTVSSMLVDGDAA